MTTTTTTKQTLKALKVESSRNSSVQTVVLGFTVVDVAADESVQLKETIEEVTIKPEKGQQYTDSVPDLLQVEPGLTYAAAVPPPSAGVVGVAVSNTSTQADTVVLSLARVIVPSTVWIGSIVSVTEVFVGTALACCSLLPPSNHWLT